MKSVSRQLWPNDDSSSEKRKELSIIQLLLHFKPVWFLADPIGNSHLGKTYIFRLKLSNVRVSKYHL